MVTVEALITEVVIELIEVIEVEALITVVVVEATQKVALEIQSVVCSKRGINKPYKCIS